MKGRLLSAYYWNSEHQPVAGDFLVRSQARRRVAYRIEDVLPPPRRARRTIFLLRIAAGSEVADIPDTARIFQWNTAPRVPRPAGKTASPLLD